MPSRRMAEKLTTLCGESAMKRSASTENWLLRLESQLIEGCEPCCCHCARTRLSCRSCVPAQAHIDEVTIQGFRS